MFYLIDSYSSEILQQSEDRAIVAATLDTITSESGIFIYRIVEAENVRDLNKKLEDRKMDEDTTTNEESELYQMKRDSWEQEQAEQEPESQEEIEALQSLVRDLWELLTFDVTALDPQSQATYKRLAFPLLMRVYEDRVKKLAPLEGYSETSDDNDSTTAQQELEDFEGSNDLPGAGDVL